MAVFPKPGRRLNGILLALPGCDLPDNGSHLGLLRGGQLLADVVAVMAFFPLIHFLQLHAVVDQVQPSGQRLPGEALGDRLRNADN
ncbi:hypothetical protein D3C71_2070160 [compost metagenome]